MSTSKVPRRNLALESEEKQNEFLEQLDTLLSSGRPGDALAFLQGNHPADQAEVLEDLDAEHREELLRAMSPEAVATILEYLDSDYRRDFVSELEPAAIADILFYLDDENVQGDILEELPEGKVLAVLALLNPEDRETVEELLELPEESAGRWMTPDVVAVQRQWSAQEAIDYLRKEGPEATNPYYLYVVDTDGHLEGVLSLRLLITAAPDVRVEKLMSADVISVPQEMDQEQAAEKLRHYNLMALPVVDEENRLVGVLSADDVLDVQVEEATEDMFLQVGLNTEETANTPVLVSLRRRVPWLLMNLTIAFISAAIINQFQSTIAKVAALAAFMPIIAGHGGNTGSQTTTLIVRSIAVGELQRRDVGRILRKELGFGLLYGVLAGVLAGALAYTFFRNEWLSLVVGVAMFGNIVLAGLAGSVIPMTLQALKVDPALASTVWLTTITDWIGFALLLGLATLLIGHLN